MAQVELSSAELEARLKEAQGRLRDKRNSLQALRDPPTHAAAHGSGYASSAQPFLFRRSEVRLLDKMKTNCQVFKEEISLVHLNRQVAHLQTALQDCQDKVTPGSSDPPHPHPHPSAPDKGLHVCPYCGALF